ncbi:MAG: hypothetical protein QXN16_04090 [Candidatus Micrarchaeaceae archaeon]
MEDYGNVLLKRQVLSISMPTSTYIRYKKLKSNGLLKQGTVSTILSAALDKYMDFLEISAAEKRLKKQGFTEAEREALLNPDFSKVAETLISDETTQEPKPEPEPNPEPEQSAEPVPEESEADADA